MAPSYIHIWRFFLDDHLIALLKDNWIILETKFDGGGDTTIFEHVF